LRKPSPASLPVLLLVETLLFAGAPQNSIAQSSRASAAVAASRQCRTPLQGPTSAGQLPVTRVSLYKNGVSFFEHSGHVVGNQSITVDFTSAQLNDVLQSLTAIDLGDGSISGATYNSTAAIEQKLGALPLALNEQLEPIFAAKRALADLDRQLQARQNEINTISEDRKRVRQNTAALKGSAEERALTTRYTSELNAQEDRLATLHKEIASLNQERKVATEDLSNKIEALNIDEKN
jgi:hypothetical protein